MIVSSLLRTCDYYRLANRCWKLRSFSGTTLARNAEYVNSVSNFAHCWGCIFGRQYYFCFLHSSDEVWWINEKSCHLCRDRTTKKNIWILGPVQTHPDFFEKGDLLLRFQGKKNYPSRLSVFESFSAIHTKTLKRRKDDSIPYGARVMLAEHDVWHHRIGKPPFSSVHT